VEQPKTANTAAVLSENGKNNGSRSVVRVGWEIICLECGEKAVKLRQNAKFCCDRCRIDYFNRRNQKQINIKVS